MVQARRRRADRGERIDNPSPPVKVGRFYEPTKARKRMRKVATPQEQRESNTEMSGGSIPPVGTYRIKQKIILIMDYEKKYNNALIAVKKLQEANPNDEGIQNWIDDSFPELKESEDEKVRNELIDAIRGLWENDALPMPLSVERKDKWIAWLEKQAERKTPQWMIDFLDNYRRKIGCSLDYDEARDVDGKILCIKEWLEKQGEQNPAWSEEDERLYQSIIDDTV